MKLFGQTVASMYLWAIALLLLLAVYSSYSINQFPFPLIVAAILAPVIELAVLKISKKQMKVPWSGIITGLIIGEVAPVNAPLAAIAVACAIAILSKYFIRIKSSNVFNPATIGMLISFAIFAIGDEWWGAGTISLYSIAIPASIVLVIAAYEAKRLMTAISFIVSVIILSVFFTGNTSLSSIGVTILGVNYFFALLMLADPKTSPHKNRAQVVYGTAMGILYSILAIFGVAYSYFMALLIGNLVYALYRNRGHKLL